MRRGGPIKRTKGLSTGTPLKPGKGLKRRIPATGSSWVQPKRSTGLQAKPKPMTPEERDSRKTVQTRSLVDGVRMCEIAIPGVCLGRATNYSHRVNASQCGKYEPASALDACGSGTTGCHGHLHANPAVAYENGWLVKSWDDPLTRPVLYRGRWVLLDNHGGAVPVERGKAA